MVASSGKIYFEIQSTFSMFEFRAKLTVMINLLKTTPGKLLALAVCYIPFACALFFRYFEGRTFESSFGGCCISVHGVVASVYALLTIWFIGPALVVYLLYRLYNSQGSK